MGGDAGMCALVNWRLPANSYLSSENCQCAKVCIALYIHSYPQAILVHPSMP